MITYEDAKKTALQINKKFNSALDYDTAWVFSIKDDMSKNNPNVAIMKNTGKPLSFTEFLLTRNSNGSPKSIPF